MYRNAVASITPLKCVSESDFCMALLHHFELYTGIEIIYFRLQLNEQYVLYKQHKQMFI